MRTPKPLFKVEHAEGEIAASQHILDMTREGKTGTLERMKRKIDSVRGRHIYSHRLGIVEPVFGNITAAIGIKRFSLRGREKVMASGDS